MKLFAKRQRFKVTENGYKFDKNIFNVGVALILLFPVLVFFVEGAGNAKLCSWCPSFTNTYLYVECPDPGVECDNPFYCNALDVKRVCSCALKGEAKSICDVERIKPGEVLGHKPDLWARSYALFALIIFAACFLFNHAWHNRVRSE